VIVQHRVTDLKRERICFKVDKEERMTIYQSDQAEKEAAKITAMLMAAAARTAPKARGQDSTKTLVLDGNDIETCRGYGAKGTNAPHTPQF
jgi:hypothetical protein